MGTRILQNSSFVGGGTRDRTADLLHAMQALSQLSYTPDEGGRIIGTVIELVNKIAALRLMFSFVKPAFRD